MTDMDEKRSHSFDPEASLPDSKEKPESSSIGPPPAGADNVVTHDGFRLHPQPTSDPLDPLNWSSLQKHTILGIVMYLCVVLSLYRLLFDEF